MNLYKLDIRGFLFGSIKILILLLLFFGISFTKINVTGSIYLYDLILVILFVLSLIGVNKIHISSKIFLFIIVGLIFVIFSMISENPLKFVLRQGMVIGYLLIIFFIYRKIKIWDKELIEFIITTSKLAFYIQVSYLIFLLINGGNVFVGFNYYSPAVVILFPVYSARILIYEKNTSLNFLQILFYFINLYDDRTLFGIFSCLSNGFLFLYFEDYSQTISNGLNNFGCINSIYVFFIATISGC